MDEREQKKQLLELRRTPKNIPSSFRNIVGRKVEIPFPDIPTVGGMPIERVASKPDVWQPVPSHRAGKGNAGKFT